jgi:hypothetical protein
MFDDFEKYGRVPEEYAPPERKEYQPAVNCPAPLPFPPLLPNPFPPLFKGYVHEQIESDNIQLALIISADFDGAPDTIHFSKCSSAP